MLEAISLLEEPQFRGSYMGEADYIFGKYVPNVGYPTVSMRYEASHYGLTVAHSADYFLGEYLAETGCITWMHNADQWPPAEIIEMFGRTSSRYRLYRRAKHLPKFEVKGDPPVLIMNQYGFYPEFDIPEGLGPALWQGTASEMTKELYRQLIEQHMADNSLYSELIAKLSA